LTPGCTSGAGPSDKEPASVRPGRSLPPPDSHDRRRQRADRKAPGLLEEAWTSTPKPLPGAPSPHQSPASRPSPVSATAQVASPDSLSPWCWGLSAAALTSLALARQLDQIIRIAAKCYRELRELLGSFDIREGTSLPSWDRITRIRRNSPQTQLGAEKCAYLCCTSGSFPRFVQRAARMTYLIALSIWGANIEEQPADKARKAVEDIFRRIHRDAVFARHRVAVIACSIIFARTCWVPVPVGLGLVAPWQYQPQPSKSPPRTACPLSRASRCARTHVYWET
jgi:hypothetical protein